VYTPTDRLARGTWRAGIAWQVRRPRLVAVCAAPGACQPIPNFQGSRAKRSVGSVHFAVVGRASARIRLSLKINILLTIGEIYKMVEDFSTQFSPLYLLMKYLAIISGYPVYIYIYIYIYTQWCIGNKRKFKVNTRIYQWVLFNCNIPRHFCAHGDTSCLPIVRYR